MTPVASGELELARWTREEKLAVIEWARRKEARGAAAVGVFAPLRKAREKGTRYIGAYGGRGSGKSYFFAEEVVRAMVEDPDLSVACIREVQKSLKDSSKKTIEGIIRRLRYEREFEVQTTLIKRRGGHGYCIFTGMQNHTADTIKSLEGFKLAWVEEAQNISARSLELLTPTFRGGAQMMFSWNPNLPDDPVDALFRGDGGGYKHPSMISVAANWMDNPYFPDDLRMDMEWDRARNADKYQHVWMGGYLTLSEARVFRNWTVQDFETPKDAKFYHGADWGFSIDPVVLVRCYIEGRKLFFDQECYKVGLSVDHSPHFFAGMNDPNVNGLNMEALKDLRAKGIKYEGMETSRAWPIVADSARPETIDYMKRHGFPRIVPSVKGARSVEEGVEFLQNYDIVIHPRCKHLIDEFAHYSYEIDDRTNQVIPKLKDKDNHGIDAARYATEPLRKPRAFKLSRDQIARL